MRTKVILHGAMALHIGKSEWEFDVKYPMEVFSAIEANTERMFDFLYNNLETEFRFVINGKNVRNFEELLLGEVNEMQILPVLKGAGSSQGGILALIGIVIIAAVIGLATAGIGLAPAATSFAGLSSLSATSAFFLTVGVALTLSGIGQLLAPTAKVDTTEKPENKPSYIFNGPVNTYRQGNPVPICLGGPFRTGSQIISAGIRSVDIVN